MRKIDALLLELRSRGVQIWIEGDRLRYKAPKDALTKDLLDQVKACKAEIISFLTEATTLTESQLPPVVAINRDDKLPLSFAQQRLWFLNQFEPNSSSSNMPVVVRITGALEVDVLERSVTEVFSRHEVLRTTFPALNGQPTLVIGPPSPVPLPVVNLQQLPDPERDTEAFRLATEEACAPFDLANGPILRVKLLRLSDTESLFIWNLHCIICDGASSDIFYQDLTAIYAAFCAGNPSPLAALPIQYVDFAHWQRQWLQGDVLNSQLKYWKQKLDHLPSAIQLPTDHIRPTEVQTYRGDRAARMLPKSLNKKLNTLSQEMGSTLFMVLLSAFEVLLYRYSNQEDMLISFASAGRGQVETEGLIGFFSNTLLLRTDFSGNPTFRELLNRVRQESLEAYAHQDIPFEKLIEELRPEQNQTRSPLFQIKFALNPPWSEGRGMASVHLQDLTFTSLFGYIYHGKTKYDLTLVMREQDEGLGYVFDYNADLFEATTVNRMLDHFQNLLEGILANPDQRLSELPLLTLAEQQQLLQHGAKIQASLPQYPSIHQAFEAQAQKTPNAIALIYKDTQLTYRELNHQANQFAHYLQSLGVVPNTHVGIYLERSLHAILVLLGILKAGGTCIPIDSAASPAQIVGILKDAQTNILVTQFPMNPVLDRSVQVIELDSTWANIQQNPETSPEIDSISEALAYILYPHQTYSQPIGVSLLHSGIMQLAALEEGISLTTTDVFLQSNSLSSEIAIFEIWGSLLNGATLTILPPKSFSPSDLGQILEQHQVTAAWFPTRLLHQIANEPIKSLKSLRYILTGRDALSPNVVKKLSQDLPGCKVINAYSLPENTGLTCYNLDVSPSSTPASIPVGQPTSAAQAYILDPYNQLVPIGIVGNLHIGGGSLAQGYFNHPELTASKFVLHFLNPNSKERLYKTGDLARYLADGKIERVGHADAIATVYGLPIEVSRVETALSQHPDVWESLVVLQSYAAAQPEDLVAYVVPIANQSLAIAELHHFIKQKVPSHMIPSAYVILAALPLASDGTIDSKALPLPDRSNRPDEKAFVTAQDKLELQLIQIWETILGIQPISTTDNFFDLGGHSLIAVRIFAQISDTFGKNLPLSVLLKAPTIEKLAAVIRQDATANHWSLLVELHKGTGSQPPLFCIHGGGFNVLIYRDLAINLGPEQTVYGIQAQGMDGIAVKDRLEEIAADYIQQIRSVQPTGPYLLAGLSKGGDIGFEMAQQLLAQGQDVALLAMFDTYGPDSVKLLEPLPRFLSSLTYAFRYSLPRLITKVQKYKPKASKSSNPSQDPTFNPLTKNEQSNDIKQIPNHTPSFKNSTVSGILNPKSPKQWMEYISQYILEHSPWIGIFDPLYELRQIDGSYLSEAFTQMRRSYEKVHQAYQFKKYPGRVTLFRAMESPPGYWVDSHLGWQEIAENGVELYEIPGHHLTMLKSPVLAEKMNACVKRASSS